MDTRDAAVAAYGDAVDGEEEEGVFEWEQWEVENREITVDYADDGAVLTLTVSLTLPM